MKRIAAFFLTAVMALSFVVCGLNTDPQNEEKGSQTDRNTESTSGDTQTVEAPENFVLIKGGTFQMGSPEDEAWRSSDETQHSVTVSDFYMSQYELTQAEYEAVMGENPSNFSGDDLPVETITWLDAITYCNTRSEQEGRTPVYTVEGQNVSWDRSADGYRLPTEAEWEYACRAGTTTPFYIAESPSAEDANYYGRP